MRLRDGSEVDLRPVTPADGPGLQDLYSSLCAEDRHLRFFSAHRVTGEVADDFARVADHGGFGVVAVDPQTGAIVGDGRCGPIEDGLTDMAVTVRGDFQGAGLGAALRDALSAEARSRGIDLLVADLLTENQRMHGVLRSVPHVLVDRPGEHVARLVYRSDGTMPDWPTERRPRVVVESRAWLGTMDERALRDAGAQVAVCPGPDAARGRSCPAAAGGTCPLVESADAVIFGLPLDDDAGCGVLAGHVASESVRSRLFVRPWPKEARVPAGATVLRGPVDVVGFLGALRTVPCPR